MIMMIINIENHQIALDVSLSLNNDKKIQKTFEEKQIVYVCFNVDDDNVLMSLSSGKMYSFVFS